MKYLSLPAMLADSLQKRLFKWGCPLRISTPSPTKGASLVSIFENYFRPSNPKIFLRPQKAPILTNFEGKMGVRKKNYLVKVFRNCLQTLFWSVFSNFEYSAEKVAITGSSGT